MSESRSLRAGWHLHLGSRCELRYEPWPNRWPRVPSGCPGWIWRGLIGRITYYDIVLDDFHHVFICVPFHVVIRHCRSERSLRKARR